MRPGRCDICLHGLSNGAISPPRYHSTSIPTSTFLLDGYSDGPGLLCQRAGIALDPGLVSPLNMISYLLASQKPDPRPFIIGISLAFLVITPWWIRNLIHFGSPTFSTQQFAAAGYNIGYIRWKEGTYTLYFGQDLPSFSTKAKRWGISQNNRGFSDLFTVSVYRYQKPSR